ncbi:MAG: NACHT domain-containing protein [Chloroflexi bacterium]|nr:NACHT domain-containing protein [Chloroflexota bacterium]
MIGRQKEMADLTATLRDPDCRLLTLTGPGGVGKTRLAQEITVVMAADFLNGARYVSLASVPHPDYLITAVAAALNLSLTPQPSPAEQLSQHLRRQEQLLVLDNFDQMLPVADWLDEVLAVSPSLKILITSRERLNLQQEWLYPLSGLPYPDDQAAPPPSPTPAETLFTREHATSAMISTPGKSKRPLPTFVVYWPVSPWASYWPPPRSPILPAPKLQKCWRKM